MNKLEKGFRNEKLGLELDIYQHEDKEWFWAKDIADFLGYDTAFNMTRLITFEENVATHNMSIGPNNSNVTMINEMGLYEILCKITKADMDRYNKAREFQKWVFGEVLPEIRKYGAYVLADDEKQVYEHAIAGYKAAIARMESDKVLAREFAETRSKTIDRLNDDIEDIRYRKDKLLLCCNDLRFIIGKMFVKRNNLDIDIENVPVSKQEDIFNQIAVDYPELKDVWYKVIKLARGEDV